MLSSYLEFRSRSVEAICLLNRSPVLRSALPNRRLLLIRHCESSGQSPDSQLTHLGFRQTDALADFLTGRQIDFVVSSVFRRARQSIEPFAAARGLRVHVEPRFNERTMSKHPISHWRDVVRDSFDDPDLRAPGGESAREVLDRAWSGINELVDGGYELPLAVTHGNLLSLVLNSLDDAFGFEGWESLSNPDVYILQRTMDDRVTYERLWTP